ncbi:ribonuclease domain-containing protein [Actinacidiphila alni]|uniref:ribonuclease domain-containing protein n=1 Tax=Actinacidiphila alni TaxID=380248 RepID=UPI0033C5EB5A
MLRTLPRTVAAVLATCLLALFCALLGGCADSSASPAAAHSTGHSAGYSATVRAPAWAEGHRTVRAADLPAQARDTLALIDRGGPYPYRRDGVVFGNLEKELPAHPRGYYHEYTVPTPGSRDRGARRIVTGRNDELFYTDDHYQSFEAVLR